MTLVFYYLMYVSDKIPNFLVLSGGIYWKITLQHVAISCATTLGIMK